MNSAHSTLASTALYQEAIGQFGRLLDEATTGGEPEPTAMTLATADSDCRLSARVVLLKIVDERGFVFFTNYGSAKAAQLAAQPRAALCLLWKTLRHGVQVRVEGIVEKAGEAESDKYFASRARASRIGAWASLQSRTLRDRAELDTRVADIEQRFADRDVTRPEFWGGYRLVPDMIEFWYGQRARLHDRERYDLGAGVWTKQLLYP